MYEDCVFKSVYLKHCRLKISILLTYKFRWCKLNRTVKLSSVHGQTFTSACKWDGPFLFHCYIFSYSVTFCYHEKTEAMIFDFLLFRTTFSHQYEVHTAPITRPRLLFTFIFFVHLYIDTNRFFGGISSFLP